MPRITLQSWVQSVYNTWERLGKTLGNLSPGLNTFFISHEISAYNYQPIHQPVPTIHTQLYTRISSQFNLLNVHLYPVSTAPTIYKNEEKIRKEQ